MATLSDVTPAPEVNPLLYYIPDQQHHMLFATMRNSGIRIGETRESFDLRELSRLCSCCQRRCGRLPKYEVHLVQVTPTRFATATSRICCITGS